MRELGFKSSLLTNFGISAKSFVIRPDEGFRYLNGAWIDDNHSVINIRLHFYKKFNESVRFDDRDYTDMVPRGNQWRETDNKTYNNLKSKFGIDYQDLGYILVDIIENFDLNYRLTIEKQNDEELVKVEFFPQINDIDKLFGETNFIKWLYSKMGNEKADDYLMYLEEIDNRLNDYNLTIRDVLPKSFRKNKEDFPYDFYAGEKYIQLWIKNINI